MAYSWNFLRAFCLVHKDKMLEKCNKFYEYYKNYNEERDVGIKERIYPCQSFYEEEKMKLSDPTEIIDGVYLGSGHNAGDWNLLKRLNIGLIVNMAEEISNFYEDRNIEYLKYGIKDDGLDEICKIDEIITKINEFKNNNEKNILIHCFVGASRSAVIMAGYLVKYHNMTLTDSLTHIKNKRYINPTRKLFMELEKYSNNFN